MSLEVAIVLLSMRLHIIFSIKLPPATRTRVYPIRMLCSRVPSKILFSSASPGDTPGHSTEVHAYDAVRLG